MKEAGGPPQQADGRRQSAEADHFPFVISHFSFAIGTFKPERHLLRILSAKRSKIQMNPMKNEK
jgi:hypothetical protein